MSSSPPSARYWNGRVDVFLAGDHHAAQQVHVFDFFDLVVAGVVEVVDSHFVGQRPAAGCRPIRLRTFDRRRSARADGETPGRSAEARPPGPSGLASRASAKRAELGIEKHGRRGQRDHRHGAGQGPTRRTPLEDRGQIEIFVRGGGLGNHQLAQGRRAGMPVGRRGLEELDRAGKSIAQGGKVAFDLLSDGDVVQPPRQDRPQIASSGPDQPRPAVPRATGRGCQDRENRIQ